MKRLFRSPIFLFLISIFGLLFIIEVLGALFIKEPVNKGLSRYKTQEISSSTSSFIFKTVNDQVILKDNQKGILKTPPFKIKKEEGVIRIMIFGGSSVYALSFKKFQADLEKAFPQRKFEILNMGGNSYGTTRILFLMSELARYSPDFFLLYSGHNEFSEKFIFDFLSPPKTIGKLNKVLLTYSKGFRWLNQITQKALSQNASRFVEKGNKGLVPKFPAVPDSDWSLKFNKEKVYDLFEINMTKIIQLSQKNKIPLVLGTVAYNRERPPFLEKEKLYENCPKVRSCLEHALEKDLQPHRATNRINSVIKSMAKKHQIPLIDFDEILIKKSKNNIPGFSEFHDHCHLKAKYNFEVLEFEFAKKLIKLLR